MYLCTVLHDRLVILKGQQEFLLLADKFFLAKTKQPNVNENKPYNERMSVSRTYWDLQLLRFQPTVLFSDTTCHIGASLRCCAFWLIVVRWHYCSKNGSTDIQVKQLQVMISMFENVSWFFHNPTRPVLWLGTFSWPLPLGLPGIFAAVALRVSPY